MTEATEQVMLRWVAANPGAAIAVSVALMVAFVAVCVAMEIWFMERERRRRGRDFWDAFLDDYDEGGE